MPNINNDRLGRIIVRIGTAAAITGASLAVLAAALLLAAVLLH